MIRGIQTNKHVLYFDFEEAVLAEGVKNAILQSIEARFGQLKGDLKTEVEQYAEKNGILITDEFLTSLHKL